LIFVVSFSVPLPPPLLSLLVRPGYSDSNWSEFPSFLDGKLMGGYEKGGSLAPRAAGIRRSVRYADRIHSVIFVISAQEADQDVEGNYAKRLRFFIDACNQQGQKK
jgi:hypothetical protein